MDEGILDLLRGECLWTVIHQLWGYLIQDDYVLRHKDPECICNYDEFMFLCHVLVAVESYLLLALRGGADAKSVEGKRLAGMGSGRLALVPELTQEGDFIAVLYGNKESIHHYLFHPIRPDGEDISIDDRILWFKDEPI